MSSEIEKLKTQISDLQTELDAAETKLADIEKQQPFPPAPVNFQTAEALAQAMTTHRREFEAHQTLVEAASTLPRGLRDQLLTLRRQLERLEAEERIVDGGDQLLRLAINFGESLKRLEADWEALNTQAEALQKAGWHSVHGKFPLNRQGWRPDRAFGRVEVAEDQVTVWSKVDWEARQRRLGRVE